MYVNVMFYFFFHAEDGIRDGTVTGVQTCALPISRHSQLASGPAQERRGQLRERGARRRDQQQIGRASCRERVWISVVAEPLINNHEEHIEACRSCRMQTTNTCNGRWLVTQCIYPT